MTPAAYIEAAATAALAGTGTFLYDSAEQATLSVEDAGNNAPYIILYDYTTSQTTAASRVQSSPITLYFASTKPGQGDKAEVHHDAVAAMEALKRRFFALLDTSPVVQIDGMRATPFANAYQAMLDGVGATFTLTVPAASLAATCL